MDTISGTKLPIHSISKWMISVTMLKLVNHTIKKIRGKTITKETFIEESNKKKSNIVNKLIENQLHKNTNWIK